MSTIVVIPKTKEEEELLTKILNELNIDSQIINDPVPNYKTKRAIKDVELKKGYCASLEKRL